MLSAVKDPGERATQPLWWPPVATLEGKACFPQLSLPQFWNWPFHMCVLLFPMPQANLQVPLGPAPARLLAAFPEQGHIPTELSFPRGQAHELPPQLSPAALGEETPPRANPRPFPGIQELLEMIQVAVHPSGKLT